MRQSFISKSSKSSKERNLVGPTRRKGWKLAPVAWDSARPSSGLDFERRPTNHGSFLLLLVTLARALPPASTRPFFACSSRLHTRHDQYLTWPSTHGRRCTRTTTAQVCAFTCQWKISPRKKTNGPTFLPLHFSSNSFFNYFKGGLKFRKY